MIVTSIFVVALLTSPTPEPNNTDPTKAATPPALITPVSARSSSSAPDYKAYTFGPANLIDGSVETSWQPSPKASEDMLGVGQWFEVDLGGTFDVSAWEVEMGLQKIDPKLGDLFCRNTRPSQFFLHFDDGSYSSPQHISPNERRLTSLRTEIYRAGLTVPSARTRYVRFIITQVFEAVDWKDPAIAELRLYGKAAPSPVANANAVCPSADFAPFVHAIVEHCAGLNSSARRKVGCSLLIDNFVSCRSTVFISDFATRLSPLPPIAAEDLVAGKVSYHFIAYPNAETEVDFVKTGETWQVKEIKRSEGQWPEQIVLADSNKFNRCWESLGKTRR